MENKSAINIFSTMFVCLLVGIGYAFVFSGLTAGLSTIYLGVLAYCGFSWCICQRGPQITGGAFLLAIWAIVFPLIVLILFGEEKAQAFMDNWWAYFQALTGGENKEILNSGALVPFLFVTFSLVSFVIVKNFFKKE